MSDAAVLLDAAGRHLSHNAAFAEAAGAGHRRVRKALAQMTAPFELLGAVAGSEQAHVERVLRTGSPIHLAEIVVRNAVGATRKVNQSFIPIADVRGAACAVIVVYRDVTAEARVQARYRELLEREKARVDDLERCVEERTAQLAAALEEVRRISHRDSLTGALNRRAFDELAEQAWHMARRHERSFGIILLDLDHFKHVNDTYGHKAGDIVLTETARALTAAVRTTDKVARYGGEEFIVLLPETSADGAAQVAHRCAEHIRAMPVSELVPGFQGRQTASVGVAVYPHDGGTVHDVIGRADQAMYRAKRTGRDQVVTFDAMTRSSRRHLHVCAAD